ncbi:hypothetical protein LX15_001886 [Streptoalloteichus tenebrarius]|uniref:Secreted protein n=1 Tax=Streptoalloteichus tenebrarius (strain ATCC 17920 / DSM 40477 / JCM 4838 / CBS 697.72 / NBRC 16177 / NCIMB 11028 / NRRL B-12390 / A12253. 1 / ISP 5477) TaxID=1933 RepID=A0ABT1HRQ1_STRSD|nr:hypothetical protein [Streptoalloteichus tenebrarius]MCP2258192.1 hypothetical protein [Streptoalloteichus tenebrarius]BFF04579.1 hypothetical protein GCM10020241_62540 [Streptoalloteichus tenebrarius]
MSRLRRNAALLVSGLAVSGGLVFVGGAGATASPAAPASPEKAAAVSCTMWTSNNGGNGHAYARCPNVDVTVTVRCANGESYTSKPQWKWQANRADCPRGVEAVGMLAQTR